MKKLTKVYEGKVLVAKFGIRGNRDFQQMAVSGEQKGDAFVFTIAKTDGLIPVTFETKEVSRVLSEMKAFAPKQADWRIGRKKQAADESKVKAARAEAVAAPVETPAAIKKGRG